MLLEAREVDGAWILDGGLVPLDLYEAVPPKQGIGRREIPVEDVDQDPLTTNLASESHDLVRKPVPSALAAMLWRYRHVGPRFVDRVLTVRTQDALGDTAQSAVRVPGAKTQECLTRWSHPLFEEDVLTAGRPGSELVRKGSPFIQVVLGQLADGDSLRGHESASVEEEWRDTPPRE